MYGDKWSPYENSASEKLGVTEYAGGSAHTKNELRKCMRHVVKVFEVPLADLTYRQKNMFSQLIRTPISSMGLAVSVGENFCSSSHRDTDMSFTFA